MLLISKFKIAGHSMEPMLKNGDTIIVSAIPYLFKNPKVGDIALFKIKDEFFVKRVAKIENGKYTVFGDNASDSIDSRNFGKVSKDQIIAKYIFKF